MAMWISVDLLIPIRAGEHMKHSYSKHNENGMVNKKNKTKMKKKSK